MGWIILSLKIQVRVPYLNIIKLIGINLKIPVGLNKEAPLYREAKSLI